MNCDRENRNWAQQQQNGNKNVGFECFAIMNKLIFLSFSGVIAEFPEDSLGSHCNKRCIFCLKKKKVQIYRTQSTMQQSEANWNCWPLLNHITGDHISFFIGHKWSTSVSTWLRFHIKHLNRDCSPISVAPLCLFKPACLSYIKPQKEQKGYFVTENCISLKNK